MFIHSGILNNFPNDKYDKMAYPESQLGELGQLWVLVWVTELRLRAQKPLKTIVEQKIGGPQSAKSNGPYR